MYAYGFSSSFLRSDTNALIDLSMRNSFEQYRLLRFYHWVRRFDEVLDLLEIGGTS
jgi:hypothetical protein